MKSLNAQFRLAMKAVYAIEDEDPIYQELIDEKMQFVLLEELLFKYRHKRELIAVVKERISTEGFHMGQNAKTFFIGCADEIFRKNLKVAVKIPNEDIVSRMKRLHPLWGESVMTD